MEKTKEISQYISYRNKLIVLENIKRFNSIKEALSVFKIQRSTFYKWNKAFKKEGASGLLRKSPVAYNHPNKIKQEVIDKVIALRKEFQLGSWRIKWYLERYHDITISESSVSRILKRSGIGKLYKSSVRRALHSKRYNKSTPGHHVQIDVKVILLKDFNGDTIKRFQYTAIDDATRIRALQIFQNQVNAIEFVNYVVKKFPFRIKSIRTDRGHEFQAKVHWHVEALGMEHHYNKARTPQLNGKVERSHLTDQREFYQLLTYKDDVDLKKS